MKNYLLLVMMFCISACSSMSWDDFNWSDLNPWHNDKVVNESKIESSRIEEDVASSVNSYLWNASVQTLSFMGFSSKNPQEGRLITNWKVMPKSLNEKFKVVVSIDSSELRADALDVKVYKEVKQNGKWVKKLPSTGFETEIEQAIVKKAKILYINDENKDD